MSHQAQVFFERWVAEHLASSEPWADLYPTPLSALAALRSAAALEGFGEDDLQAGVGDLVAAVTAAMIAAPPPMTTHLGAAFGLCPPTSPVEAMGLALSWLDGFREVVGPDAGMAAELVLSDLARQGFVLRRLDRAGPDLMPPTRRADDAPGADRATRDGPA